MFTLDGKIELKLDFDFLLYEQEFILHFVSIIQLNLIELIDEDNLEFYLGMLAQSYNLSLKLELKYKGLFITRFINGKEVERVNIVLSSAEFSQEVSKYTYQQYISYFSKIDPDRIS